MAQQGSLGAENLPAGTGRGGDAKVCVCVRYGYIWDCVTVMLFDCVNLGRSRSRSKSENASSNSSSPSQLPSDGNALD